MMNGQSYTSFPFGSTLAAIAAVLWLTAPTALAQPTEDDRWFGGSGAYDFCLNAIEEDPVMAFDRALAWNAQGGGPPAIHCSALALIELAQYGDAADRLDALAQDLNNGLSGLIRAQILIQAANAWIMEGFPDQGIESLDAALSLNVESSGISAQIYFDRARAHALDHEWREAVDDLTRALDYAPGAKDALTLRATSYRLLGETENAQEDIARVLDADSDYAPALLERGVLNLLAGDEEAAREDWISVLQMEAEDDLQRAARSYLYELDFPGGL